MYWKEGQSLELTKSLTDNDQKHLFYLLCVFQFVCVGIYINTKILKFLNLNLIKTCGY